MIEFMLKLKVGVTKNPRFEPLIDGTVKSAKMHLDIVVTTPPELFFRNLKNDEFDVFEMSLSEYLITREQGERRSLALVLRCRSFPPRRLSGLGFSSIPPPASQAWRICAANASACLTTS